MKTCRSAVEISHLRKTYGNLVAVDDVSVSVAEGEIFGILGPNGAGKTTAIECAIGLREPDAGQAGVQRHGQYMVVTGTGDLVNAVILALATAGVTAGDVQLGTPDLEDAFVALTQKEGAMA
jgi:ABC-type branched-subunit amino acid transport system ATPase component